MRRQLFSCILFYLSILFLLWQPVKAQYDGSFDNLYFGRTIDATSASLGSISRSVLNNAFSVHQNASLLGFQEGYSASYSYSTPFYNFGAIDRSFNYFGISAKPVQHVAFGISRFTLNNTGTSELRLSTIAVVYNFSQNFSLGTNARLFSWDLGTRTDSQGNSLESIFNQWYLDLTSAARFPYQLKGAVARFTAGLTFENIFRQELDVRVGSQDIGIELPSIVIMAATNALRWESGSNFLLTKQISWNLLGEYQNVIDYDFRTRYSLGTQFGFGDILFLRAGYYYENIDDFGVPQNKSTLNEFTYGVGANIPVSTITGIEQEIMLSIDYVQIPQPLFTTNNPFSFGDYSTISVALQIVL